MLAISDFGVGIPYNVRKIIPGVSDHDAIREALKEGFSTKSTPKNRGAGLDNIIANFSRATGGTVTIHSLKGYATCDASRPPEIQPSLASYPGTMIDFVVKTDNIPRTEDAEEDFAW